jgi:hypothetical protein
MKQYKLGKLDPKRDARTLQFKDYLITLPPIPAAVDWTEKVATWGMLANDAVGDCTVASGYHLDEVWTANTSTEVIATDAQALADYSAISGYTPDNPDSDTGCALIDVLNYWRQTGLNGRKIMAYAQVNCKNITRMKTAVALFGGIYLGIQVPSRAMDQFNAGQPWTDTSPDDIEGGHGVPGVAYGNSGIDGLTLVTWGAKQFASWDWLAKYLDEAYVILSPDWFAANNVSPANFNLDQLQIDLKAVSS